MYDGRALLNHHQPLSVHKMMGGCEIKRFKLPKYKVLLFLLFYLSLKTKADV
jgi:hypothetical protein